MPESMKSYALVTKYLSHTHMDNSHEQKHEVTYKWTFSDNNQIMFKKFQTLKPILNQNFLQK